MSITNQFQATQIIDGTLYLAFHVLTRSGRLRAYAINADAARARVEAQIKAFGASDKVIKVIAAPPIQQIEGTVRYV